MKQKNVAGILALIFGIFGVHHFYLGQRARGVLHFLLFLFTFAISVEEAVPLVMLPLLIGFIGGILLLVMPESEFNEKYNRKYIDAPRQLRANNTPQYANPSIEMQQLKKDGVQAFRARDYELATELFLDALDIDACDTSVHFNLACCYSKMKIVDLADEHLQEALENGFDRWDKIDKHPALKWYREQESYLSLLKRFQARPPRALPMAPEEDTLELDKVIEKPVAGPNSTNNDSLNTVDLLEQISRLGELREKGILTEEEFSMQKKKILGQ